MSINNLYAIQNLDISTTVTQNEKHVTIIYKNVFLDVFRIPKNKNEDLLNIQNPGMKSKFTEIKNIYRYSMLYNLNSKYFQYTSISLYNSI